MKKSEVAKLLLWAQGVDGRTLNDVTVEVWHELLGDVEYEPAIEAAREHYRESTVMIKPAHILSRLDVDSETGPLRDASRELLDEQKATWCLEHGVSVEDYDAARDRDDRLWLMRAQTGAFKAVRHG